jgi:disulfide bond formation protein DsbB
MSTRDLTDAISTGLAALAVAVQGALVILLVLALAAVVWAPARRMLREAREMLFGGELWAAWVVALVATLASLYYSEIANFIPCRLCWYQRIAMYPLSAILLLAALRRDVRGGAIYALPLSLVGMGVASYHIYIEYNPSAESAGCRIGAPCSVKWIEELGYITLPVLALTAFAAVLALSLMALSRTARRAAPREEATIP